MAFVTATPKPVQRWFSSHITQTDLLDDFSASSFNPATLTSGTVHGTQDKISPFYTPSKRKDHIITHSATQLNCYDTTKLPRVILHPIPDAYCAQTLSRTSAQRVTVQTDSGQHRSMIDLDGYAVEHIPTAFGYPQETQPAFRWLRKTGTHWDTSTQSPGRNHTSEFMRFTIQDVIQQECGIGSGNYLVDQPSKLVRIECRKPGCRCVLKNEPALALKIVHGVTLVQGRWLMSSKPVSKVPSNSSAQNAVHSYTRANYSSPASEQKLESSPVVLTTCCPSWFEIISRPGVPRCPEVPVWSSGKALWRAKPRFFLLRKPVQCIVGALSQSLTMSVADVFKPEQTSANLDASSVITLRAGTVLELLDCRACRLVHHDPAGNSHFTTSLSMASSSISGGLLSRHRSKTVPMLQCSIVGVKALAMVASVATDLSVKDGLRWLADGPRLVYLPMDSKCISCSPVVGPSMNQSESQHSLVPQKKSINWSSTIGVHSLLSLLTRSELPGLVRPLTGLRPNEWFPLGKVDRRFASNGVGEIPSHAETPLLQLEQCYHGDLVFLEPLADCTDPGGDPRSTIGQSRTSTSRFFVVTTDMLAQHNFFLAEAASTMQYSQALEIHACRVAHFLAACHPAQGLAYLIKHLEDISLSLDTGPSHVPLTRTLGPTSSSVKYSSIQAALTSVAAAAALATEDPEEFYAGQSLTCDRDSQSDLNANLHLPLGASSLSSIDRYQSSGCLFGSKPRTHSSLSSSLVASEMDQMNALCDEIEDIYFYVRNGRFPAQSRSMTSLVHPVYAIGRSHRPVPQTSAPISPQADELFSNEHLRHRLQNRRDSSSKARYRSIEVNGLTSKVAQPIPGLIRRPEKSPFLYIAQSLAQSQNIPVFTSTQSPIRDAGTPVSSRNRTNVLSSCQTSGFNINDSSVKNNTKIVRVFQSPAHDSGVDITVHRPPDSPERQPIQSTHPYKMYTNTRVLTMSKTTVPTPPTNFCGDMTQSQNGALQSAVQENCKHLSYRKLSTESSSAFRLQAPRGNPVNCVNAIDEQPITQDPMQFGRCNFADSDYMVNIELPPTTTNNQLHTIGRHSGPAVSHYSTLGRVTEQSTLAKSPIRVIDLRNVDSQPYVAHRSTHVLSHNSPNVSIPPQHLSYAPATTTSSNTINTRPRCSCQTTNYRVPSNQRSVKPTSSSPAYRLDPVWCDQRTGQPVGQFIPQPVVMLSAAPSEEQLNWSPEARVIVPYSVPQSIGPPNTYATTTSRQSKHRTELTNSSPDTGIGGESGVEIPCTVLPVPCGNNAWPPVHGTSVRVDVSNRASERNAGSYGSYLNGSIQWKQIYQI